MHTHIHHSPHTRAEGQPRISLQLRDPRQERYLHGAAVQNRWYKHTPPPHSGNIAVSPIAATAITGFSLTPVDLDGYATSTQLTGNASAPGPGALFAKNAAALTVAVLDMQNAYTDAASRATSDSAKLNLGGGILGGAFGGEDAPLTPGVYTFASNVNIADSIYFEGSGGDDANDIFIIQITGNLAQAASTNVVLRNGAKAENIFWQVAGLVLVQVGAHLEGIILTHTLAVFMTGASLHGRVLAQTAVTIQMANITEPVLCPM